MTLASVTHEGITVESHTETDAQLRTALGLPEAPAAEPSGDPAADPAAEDSEPAPDPSSQAGAQLAGKKKSLQARIDALTREKHETRREADAHAARVAALQAELETLRPTAPAPAPTPAPPSDKPSRAAFIAQIGTQYDSYEAAQDAYDDARDAWRDTQAQQTAQQRAAAAMQREALTASQQRAAAFMADHPDYEAKVNAVQVPAGIGRDQLIAHLTFSEFGPQLAYELADDPALLAAIVSRPPALVVEALGELKATIKARQGSASTGPDPTPVAITRAAAPIKPVGSGPVVDDGPPGEDADDEAHRAYYNRKDLDARRRR